MIREQESRTDNLPPPRVALYSEKGKTGAIELWALASTRAVHQGLALSAGDGRQILGRDSMCPGSMRRLPIPRVTGDHSVGVQGVKIPLVSS